MTPSSAPRPSSIAKARAGPGSKRVDGAWALRLAITAATATTRPRQNTPNFTFFIRKASTSVFDAEDHWRAGASAPANSPRLKPLQSGDGQIGRKEGDPRARR